MIGTNIQKLKQETGQKVKLIAVSKTKPVEVLLEAYHEGQRAFGENKAQDMCMKYELLPKDIEWHFIGHLQTNKIKYLIPFVSLIHSIDSSKLLQALNKEAAKVNRVIPVLLQIHIAKEETKYGFNLDELIHLLEDPNREQLKNISILGLMGMATNTSDEKLIRDEFLSLKELYENLKTKYFENDSNFKEISMGMSSDYKLAVECGSTMIRVGSLIFGERNSI